ncbi:hypothetical protein GCM10009733_020470 [Nonomuraea maheshkhaliensis]|uniref:Methyltransferase n=1 Tax=Nonomuraea maheshkhaliensis TaxID=419590 RepID=A0ABN2EZE5_9ACTN
MLKLTKEQANQHRKADELVTSSTPLSSAEVEFVLTHWQEASNITNPLDSAFFTPLPLAKELGLHVQGARVIDLCAGIGSLAWGYRCRYVNDWELDKPPLELVCVEKNPDYVAVGQRLLPDATWILGDVFDVLTMGLGQFDAALSNPPFGRAARSRRRAPRYRGPLMEFHVIDVAAHLARQGAFIIPQVSAPFSYSGAKKPVWDRPAAYRRFEVQAGIELGCGIGVDTTQYTASWHGVRPCVEIVRADFTAPPTRRLSAQLASAVSAAASAEREWFMPEALF